VSRHTKRRSHLLSVGPAEFGVDVLHVQEDTFDSSQNDTRVGMLELRHDTLADVLGFLLLVGLVVGQGRQNGDATPLGALVESE
jgi:hypothetical protein